MTKVTVYKVLLYEPKENEPLISRRMATRLGAAAMCGLAIKDTGYVVDATHLEQGNQWTALDFDPVALGCKKERP
ncbi:hypothetical protein ACKWRH_20915 [Bradyrhizobium sp. Pa8]|uniref:hypothetical protein n=1 Tax=Bradyrhizobium sp. Pa8 TaxID=3386552 RepID=UPI00403FAE51